MACGLVAGVMTAGVFNPFDRALYLSVISRPRRPFLSADNFRNPYNGFMQSVGGRAVSGGLFFPLEQLFKSLVLPEGAAGSTAHAANFAVGAGAGCVNAVLTNPLNAIKYRTWGRATNRGMAGEARAMWTKGGARPFFNGLLPTMLRDVVFGGCYTFLRLRIYQLQGSGEADGAGVPDASRKWIGNMAAAGIATVVSGPFNLARNEQYAAKARNPRPSMVHVLRNLWWEARAARNAHGTLAGWSYVQQRLRVGWGTVRVACGMAFGHHVYDACMAWADDSTSDATDTRTRGGAGQV